MKPNLTLYHLPGCPFCRAVRQAAAQLGLELDLIDIRREPRALEFLLQRRGARTVPVLHIRDEDGDRLLPEARDIIAYLERVAAESQPAKALAG